jgi:hypothetical protein
VESVYGLGGDLDGGVESKGHIGAVEVIINGLWDSDARDTLFAIEAMGDIEAAVTTDDNQAVEAVFRHSLEDDIGLVGLGQAAGEIFSGGPGKGIVDVAGAENGSTLGHDPGEALVVEFAEIIFHDTAKAIAEAKYLDIV